APTSLARRISRVTLCASPPAMPGSGPEPLPPGHLARPQYSGAAATRSARSALCAAPRVTRVVPRSSLLESARSRRGHRRADLLRENSLREFPRSVARSSRASLYLWPAALRVPEAATADTSLASRY